MENDVTGLILAGGWSRRFGSDKAVAEVGGIPMIARVYGALAPLCSEILVSVGTETCTYDLPGHVRYVTDHTAHAGPLGGLEAGLAESNTPWLLVVACDLPYLSSGVLRRLVAGRNDRLDAIIGSTTDRRFHPTCACYHRNVLPVIREQLREGRYALHALVERLNALAVHMPLRALHNVNAPDDLGSGAQPHHP